MSGVVRYWRGRGRGLHREGCRYQPPDPWWMGMLTGMSDDEVHNFLGGSGSAFEPCKVCKPGSPR